MDVSPVLANAVDELGALPVLDATVLRVLTVIDDPDASTAELVAVLEGDAAFAANLVRLANSAAFGRPVPARTIAQAVLVVGRRAVRRLALEAATYRFLEAAPGGGPTWRGMLHVRAVAVAGHAAAAAERLGLASDELHLAGLLHDVGRLVLPLAYGDVAREIQPPGVERERFGVDHAQAGALLAARWGMPPTVVDAVALHHGGPTGVLSPNPEVAVVQLSVEVERVMAGGVPDRPLLEAALERCGRPPGLAPALRAA